MIQPPATSRHIVHTSQEDRNIGSRCLRSIFGQCQPAHSLTSRLQSSAFSQQFNRRLRPARQLHLSPGRVMGGQLPG